MPDRSKLHELTVGGTIGEIPRAAAWAAGLAEEGVFAPSLLYAVQLCLEEALANIVMHGLEDVAEPRIRISLWESSGRLLLALEDNGTPFDPALFAAPKPPRSLEDAPPGGRGIPLMRKFSDTIGYARTGGRNCLTIAFDPARHPQAG